MKTNPLLCGSSPTISKQLGLCASLPPVRDTRSSKAVLAKPDALAAAASLLAERIRLLSLSKPPRCSAAAPSHPVFRCHYLNTLLIRPRSTEVCSHWSSAHSTWDIYMTMFPGRDRGRERHNSLLGSSCWTCLLSVELCASQKNDLSHGRSCKLNKSKSHYCIHSKPSQLVTLQLCIQPLQLVSHDKQQTLSKAACSTIRTKTGQLLPLLYFDYIKCTPVTAGFLSAGPYSCTHSHKTTLPVLHRTLDSNFSAHYQVFCSTHQHRHPQRDYPLAPAQT